MRVAAVQMTSSNDLDANLVKMRSFLDRAVKEKADLIAFPEMAYFVGSSEENERIALQFQKIKNTFSEWAKEKRVFLIPGSVREPGEDHRFYNTLLFFDRSGKLLKSYRKIFLFRANLPDRVYEEDKYAASGKEAAVCEIDGVRVGFAICFDLRFPELFRRLRKLGAELVILPAAFTVPTGKAHWMPLLQARAIENQNFLLASAMCGKMGNGAATYGHSVYLSPWGEPLKELDDREGFFVSEIDKEMIRSAETKVAAWDCRREEIYPL